MKLEKWALIAEIVSGAAIVVTLIVLILEIRTNTDAIRAQNRQSTAARAQELALVNATDPFIRQIRSDPTLEVADLTPAERSGLGSFLGAHLRNAEEAYLQYVDGRLDEAYMQTRRAIVLSLLDSPASRDAYRSIKEAGFLHAEFQDWFDEAYREMYGERP